MEENKDIKIGFYPPLRAIPYISSILCFGEDNLFFIVFCGLYLPLFA